MLVLDLFAGTGSSTRAFEDRGHDVFSVELDAQHEADLHADVMTLTADDLGGPFDLVWASPPCPAPAYAHRAHTTHTHRVTPDTYTHSMIDAVDLFAGPGGWSEAAQTVGIREVGLEWDTDACRTAVAAGHLRVQADVATYPTAPFVGVDGLIASPPCQDWSQAGKAGESSVHREDRTAGSADLTRVIGPWVEAIRPRWVACEQVRDALPVWRNLEVRLREVGYHTWSGLLNASYYGVPQKRFRAFLLASVDGPVGPPTPTHGGGLFGDYLVSAEDALGLEPGCWIDRRNNSRGPAGTTVPVAPAPCLRPAPTVTGQAGAGQWLVCSPDGTSRNLTVAGASLLQTFRPDYPWQGTKTSQAQQVGNAVPPRLAAAVLATLV